jgi:hypothetical protein
VWAGRYGVAIAGFRANRHISQESYQAERARALWEKRCSAYEEIIGILHDRQAYRSKILELARTAKAGGADLASFTPIATKYAGDFHDPATQGARNKLLAYASPEVRTAYYQMIVDDMAMGLTLVAWATKVNKERLNLFVNQDPSPDQEDMWSRFEELQKLVLKRDNELTGLIRRELGSDPLPEPPLQPWRGALRRVGSSRRPQPR